jgi:hypothetical protein
MENGRVRGEAPKINKKGIAFMRDGSYVSNTKKITVSALLLALNVLTLFFATTLPINKLSLYTLSSFFISIIIVEFGIKAGWVYYFASCFLSLIVIQIKIRLIPYVVFFGVYGIIKFYIEKLHNFILEYILKLAYFNICLAAAFIFIQKVIYLEISGINFPIWIIVIALEVIFIIFDYVYTLFAQYYINKLKPLLRI